MPKIAHKVKKTTNWNKKYAFVTSLINYIIYRQQILDFTSLSNSLPFSPMALKLRVGSSEGAKAACSSSAFSSQLCKKYNTYIYIYIYSHTYMHTHTQWRAGTGQVVFQQLHCGAQIKIKTKDYLENTISMEW